MTPRKLCDQKARDKPGALAVALEREAAAKPVQEKDEDGKDQGLLGFRVLGVWVESSGLKVYGAWCFGPEIWESRMRKHGGL